MKYCSGFLKQNVDKLTTQFGQHFTSDRANWSKISNVSHIYDEIYNTFITAGVATVQDVPVYQDINGNIVMEEEKYGELIDINIVHPEYILFANKTGLNTLSREDGHKGGTKFICGKGQVSKIKKYNLGQLLYS